jgi:hypothetical protein
MQLMAVPADIDPGNRREMAELPVDEFVWDDCLELILVVYFRVHEYTPVDYHEPVDFHMVILVRLTYFSLKIMVECF